MSLHHQKKGCNKHLLSLIISSVLLPIGLISTEIRAQPSFPSTPDPAPIDGGLGLLAAAGSAYAYKKLKYSKANINNPDEPE